MFQKRTGRLAQLKTVLSVLELWGSSLGQSNRTQNRQRLATVATFLRSCVGQALRRGNGLRYSLVVTRFGELSPVSYNEDLPFLKPSMRWLSQSEISGRGEVVKKTILLAGQFLKSAVVKAAYCCLPLSQNSCESLH